MLGRALFLSCALAMVSAAVGGVPNAAAALACSSGVPESAAGQTPATRADKAEQLHRLEGQAVIELADAAMSGKRVPSDLSIEWRNDFLKAQRGTFVPFVVTIDARPLATPSALLYVRLAGRGAQQATAARATRSTRSERDARSETPPTDEYAVEEIYPIEIGGAASQTLRVARGFSAQAGEYDLVVVVRERLDPARPGLPRRTGVLTRRLVLPDFRSDELTTSSVILADRLTVLDTLPADEQPEERPYLIGLSDIQPAADNVLRRDEELIVVLLVYNPFVTPERKFDVEVEYHFFTKIGDRRDRDGKPPAGVSRPPARDGERYFNHTKPQRFTPAIMGPQFDPSAGHPLMAGQGVPLASFPEGEYRLAIKVTDIVTGKSILRDVAFTIVS